MITCGNIFDVWPKTTLLLPVSPRDATRLDTHGGNPETKSSRTTSTAVPSLVTGKVSLRV